MFAVSCGEPLTGAAFRSGADGGEPGAFFGTFFFEGSSVDGRFFGCGGLGGAAGAPSLGAMVCFFNAIPAGRDARGAFTPVGRSGGTPEDVLLVIFEDDRRCLQTYQGYGQQDMFLPSNLATATVNALEGASIAMVMRQHLTLEKSVPAIYAHIVTAISTGYTFSSLGAGVTYVGMCHGNRKI